MRVALYLRVSTDDQCADNQLDLLHRWAAASGHDIVATFRDDGISGAKGEDKRPGLKAMMQAARRKEIDIVAAWSLDRVGRSLFELIKILQELHELERGVFFHKDAIDTSTAAGRLQFQIFGAFAEYERARISERTKAGHARVRAQGRLIGGRHSWKKGRRPQPESVRDEKLRAALDEGLSIRAAAKAASCSTRLVQEKRREWGYAKPKTEVKNAPIPGSVEAAASAP